jgi:hypothetical protein
MGILLSWTQSDGSQFSGAGTQAIKETGNLGSIWNLHLLGLCVHQSWPNHLRGFSASRLGPFPPSVFLPFCFPPGLFLYYSGVLPSRPLLLFQAGFGSPS